MSYDPREYIGVSVLFQTRQGRTTAIVNLDYEPNRFTRVPDNALKTPVHYHSVQIIAYLFT